MLFLRKSIQGANLFTLKNLRAFTNNDASDFWIRGFPQRFNGKLHPLFEDKKFKNLMSKLFDLCYIDTNSIATTAFPRAQKYYTYQYNKLDEAIGDIQAHLDIMKFSVPHKTLRKPISKDPIYTNPELINMKNSKVVFVDTSPSKTRANRAVLVRDTNGDLLHADWDTRERMNAVFYGITNQRYPYPEMLTPTCIRNLAEFDVSNVLDYIVAFVPKDSELFHICMGECFERLCELEAYYVAFSSHYLIPFLFHCLTLSHQRLFGLTKHINSNSVLAVAFLAEAFAYANKDTQTGRGYAKDCSKYDLVKTYLNEIKQFNPKKAEQQQS